MDLKGLYHNILCLSIQVSLSLQVPLSEESLAAPFASQQTPGVSVSEVCLSTLLKITCIAWTLCTLG